jgi:histidine triad (HIT) family protein
MATSCVFCRIVAGEIPSDRVHEDERVIAFRDIAPKAPVHVLVVPREHIVSLAETDAAQSELLGHCLVVAAEVARKEGVARSGFRLLANSGPDSGMEVPHLHFHVMGGRRLGGLG